MAVKPEPHDAYPLRTVSRMTGLSADVIRAWERRYGVVAPVRGPRGSRLYSAADIAHLRLLAQVVASGRAIGDVARLGVSELRVLVDARPPATAPGPANGSAAVRPDSSPLPRAGEGLLESLQRLDAAAFEARLSDALIVLGHRDFVCQVVSPLLAEIGDRWEAGTLTVGAEHLASGLLRNLLGSMIRAQGVSRDAPVVLATPGGERHELGLWIVSLLLRDAGVGVHCLGPDVPAADILSAARRPDVSVLGLGFVNDNNRARAVEEVRRIESLLPPGVDLWLGGREARAVAAGSDSRRGIVIDDLDKLDLESVRLRDNLVLHR